MQRRGFPIIGSIILAVGVALGLAAFGADTSSPRRNPNLPEFPANASTHVTRADSQSALNWQNAREIPAQTEGGPSQIPPPPTRSSFMANWTSVSGASGYRLDVSTNSSFSDYVNDYHDLDVGNVTGQVVTGLSQGTTYYYRVRAYDSTGTTSGDSTVMTATTSATIGLIINPTFDSSITTRANAATIEAMINRAISIYESLFSDPITVKILFRYSTTAPNGSPFPSGALSESNWVYYTVPWNTYIHALVADAITGYDTTANTSLPTAALSTNIRPSSANGRAVSLNTPPAMFANGAVGGGTFDGIVSLNSAAPLQLTRPTSAGNYDAQRQTEHEIDEVLGLGSRLSIGGSDLRPQDLFSWSSAGTRNLTSSGIRYFSINRGTSKIVYFNQTSPGDFGDWLSTACPQAHPYVQNAFTCPGQFSDVTVTSPEGINLDVIGYNLVNSPAPAPTDFNGDGKPDYVLYNGSTGQTVLWYLKNNTLIGAASGPTLPAGWQVVGVADFNRDGHADYLLFNPTTHQSQIWYLSGAAFSGSASGPTLSSSWELVGTGDFNKDGKSDWVIYIPSTQQTLIWYMNNNVRIGAANGPTLPAGYKLVGVADFNRDGHPDYLLFNPTTRQSQIWYLSVTSLTSAQSGPTITSGYELIGAADFNGDGKPDYLLFNPSTRQTVIWYLDFLASNVLIGTASGPTPPTGWSVVAP
jgi:FG-GAP-like repeat